MERVKKEVEKQMEQLVKTSLIDENLIKAINRKVIPVAWRGQCCVPTANDLY